MNILYVLGNAIEPSDTMAVFVAEKIKDKINQHGMTIHHIDPTESLPELPEYPLFLDTIHGINDVTVFHSLSDFSPPPRFSVHDFDLYTELSLLIKLKKIKGFTIIGVSEGGDVEKLSSASLRVILNLIQDPSDVKVK